MTENDSACAPEGHSRGGTPERREEILKAAFQVLLEKGFHKASMLAVAQRAHTSKETLYSWFGSKEGLFQAMIASRTDRIREDLLAGGGSAEAALTRFGIGHLRLVLSMEGVEVNRVAISEARQHPGFAGQFYDRARSPDRALAEYLEQLRADGVVEFADAMHTVQIFLGLLVRDGVWRRLLELDPVPGAAWIEARARETARMFLKLFAPG